MIGNDLKNRIQIHDAEVLEDLQDRLAAALELIGDLFVLQVVDQASFLDQRQQRVVDFFGHTRFEFIWPLRPSCPLPPPGPAPIPAIWPGSSLDPALW